MYNFNYYCIKTLAHEKYSFFHGLVIKINIEFFVQKDFDVHYNYACSIIIGFPNKSPFLSPVDSAIGTGMTTESHSVVGDMDDLDQLPEEGPPNATIVPGNHLPPRHPMMSHGNQLGHNSSSQYRGLHNYTDQHSLGMSCDYHVTYM